MTLRSKLLLAQAPLAIALALVGVVSSAVVTRLGQESHLILADNYRSVLAAQRMSGALVALEVWALRPGAPTEPDDETARARALFERELAVQEGNITEPREADVTAKLRRGWQAYLPLVAACRDPQRTDAQVRLLERAFRDLKVEIDEILTVNQDAIVRKSDRAEIRAQTFEQSVIAAVIVALLLGVLASGWMVARAVRPLAVVNAAVRRFGEGDPKARADVRGRDEIASVAGEFNRMAERLERYRASSLGELLAAQQAAQAAIDGLADPVLLLDAAGAVQGANLAASSLLGIDTEQPGGDALARVGPGVRALVGRMRAHVLAGKGPYVAKGFEEAVRVPSAAEGERILLPRGTPTYGEDGTVNGAALVLQDVTRLFRFDELKNDLVATVAHEFRTPLTSLRMAIHLCAEEAVGPLTPKQADLLLAARDDCERLQVIVDELLNLSRIESGNIELHRRRACAGGLVDAAVAIHQPAAEQAGLSLRKEVPPGLPEVFVDPDRLQLVFANLLTNAVRFAPRGTEIVVRARPGRAGQVRFEVADRGPGVSKQHQANLFDKFFRVPGSSEGGSGLGLFIARGIVQAHEGEIGVESEPGQGATFWFSVPAAPPAPAPVH